MTITDFSPAEPTALYREPDCFSPAGADYWFVLPEYQPVDRLAEEECPLDEMDEVADQETTDRYLAAIHSLRCPHVGMGDHLPEECPR